MNTKPVTQEEAKMVWDSLEKPSPRKVAEKFDAAGRPVDCGTIAQWEREGWPGTSVAEVAQPAPKKTEPEKAEPEKAEPKKAAPPGRRSNAQRAEDVLLKTITVAESVWDSIHDVATAAPERWRSRRRRRAPGSAAQGRGQHRQADEGLQRSGQHGDRGPATDPGFAGR
jgi:hypothetical protein